MRTSRLLPALIALALGAGAVAHAQIALSSAVDLALRNSPKVQMAQADFNKARAALSEAKDVFVPQVNTNGGYGRSTGAPLGVPIIYSISAESLVFSFSQGDYIRSAHAGVEATEHALSEAQIAVAEDVTNTYIALDNALRRRAALREEQDIAGQLEHVTNDRFNAGIDPHIEWTKAKRTVVQIRLQMLLVDGEVAEHSTHLAQLTGLPGTSLSTDPASIPEIAAPQPPAQGEDTAADSQGVRAAFAIARAKQLTAQGDRHYLLRPQIVLQANFSRVDTGLSSYLSYYPRFGGTFDNPNSQNSLGFGLSVTVPLLDMTHRSKARESAADAAHALAEANMQRGLFFEGRAKLRNAALELAARADLARLDQEVAQDQLDALRVQLQAGAANLGGTPANPKDELNARLQERQKYYDVLNSELQLQQTQVNLLRQQGGLSDWIHQSLTTPGQSPSLPVTSPQVNTPSVPGATPQSAAPTPTGTPTTTPHPTSPRP
ncbi:MAG TPA: TolC family protein [Acidobacteriaceae bacterium]|jgi:outer membrane protein TolC